MPQRPKHINKKIRKHIGRKVPHFFTHAKRREKSRVEELNDNTINKLETIIPDRRIYFSKVAGKFDYKMLMNRPHTRLNKEIVDKYTELDRSKRWRIRYDRSIKEKNRELYVDRFNREELLKVNSDVYRVVDVLVNHLYKTNNSRSKSTLWNSFGKELVENIRANTTENTIVCEECEVRVWVESNRAKYCQSCAAKVRSERQRKLMRQRRG